MTLDEIEARLMRWEEQIPQFWIVWEQSGEAEGKHWSTKDEWARGAHDEEYRHNLSQTHRSLATRDAEERGYFPTYQLGASATDPPVTLRYGTGARWTRVVQQPFLGLWANEQDRWLGSALAQLSARLDGTFDWKGRELPLLVVMRDPQREIQLALDPEAGYLPRLAKYVHIDGEERKEGFKNEVTEFRELKPVFFFPWSGRFTHSENLSNWTMVDVRVNEPLDTGLFRVTPGPGTKIENAIAGPPTAEDRVAPPLPLIQRLRWPLLTILLVTAMAMGARELRKARKNLNGPSASGTDGLSSG
jgi:hypothetical protein